MVGLMHAGRYRVRAAVLVALSVSLWVLAVGVGAFMLGAMGGCSEWRVVRDDKAAEAEQERASAADDAIAGVIQRFEQAVGAGVDRLEASAQALETMANTPEVSPQITQAAAEAVGAGVPADEALRAARAALQARVSQITAYRAELAAERTEARASDEATLSLVELGIGFLPGGLLGAGVAGLAAVKKLRAAKIKQAEERQAGVVEGASIVRDSVRVGRAADPGFDKLFRGDSSAARAMREAIERTPEIAAIVRAASSPSPTPPEGLR